MNFRWTLFFLSIFIFGLFTLFSYTVAKETYRSIDFDTTVKLQNKVSKKVDPILSYLSVLASAEVAFSIAAILSFLNLIKLKFLPVIGWLMIIPASMVEVFGKLVLFHPGTPVLFHRTIVATELPSFYIETNFSYPSGHMTRTMFLVTVVIVAVWMGDMSALKKSLIIGGLLIYSILMAISRVSLGEHWLSDVLGGILLGTSVGLFAAILIIRKQNNINLLPVKV